jgi:hypothetical protein
METSEPVAEKFDSLTYIRDRGLADIEAFEPGYQAVLGARILREVAFMRWCPACRDGEHWNHDDQNGKRKVTRGDLPEPGACWTTGNGFPCTCPWRLPSETV